MSALQSSLAVEEVEEILAEPEFSLLIPRHSLIRHGVSSEYQPVRQAIRVTGSITVSF